MTISEWFAAVGVLLLSLYGCAQLIRRVCLWLTRCPRTMTCYRLVVPKDDTATEPLFCCLQAQAVWADIRSEKTLVLLPPNVIRDQETWERLLKETPSVIPMTAEELFAFLSEG